MNFSHQKSVMSLSSQDDGLAPFRAGRATRPLLRTGGITLIETVVYIALFSIIIGGAVVAAYQIFESSGRDRTHVMIQEEGDFLIAKINWALSGVQNITGPATPPLGGACTNSNTLTVTKWSASIGVVVVKLVGGEMLLSRGGGLDNPLNNSNTSVSALSFTHCYTGGTNPESVSASFTLSARTPSGATISQNFFTTSYVRK